jgi:hypothetical protein
MPQLAFLSITPPTPLKREEEGERRKGDKGFGKSAK